MDLEEFLKQPGSWALPEGDEGIVIRSRVRVARNLKDAAFPGWAGEGECERIWRELRPVLQAPGVVSPSWAVGMSELSELDRQILFERHLISHEQAGKGRGSGVVISHDERVVIMVNEEDHLRMQTMRPGLDIVACWKAMDSLDDAVEKSVRYAFSPRWGYLTACPTNVGTGLRASVLLHLPGLVLLGEINPIVKGISKIGLAVRGLWGEGTESVGNMFQVSNQISLGDREEHMVAGIEQIAQELVEHEKNARARLLEKRDLLLKDHVGRALGILQNAHILTSKEALELLSALRLGLDLGILRGVGSGVVDELLVTVQPAHLQKAEGKALKPKDRDRARADWVRKKLAGVQKAA